MRSYFLTVRDVIISVCGWLFPFKLYSSVLWVGVLMQDDPYGDESAELLGGGDSGYGALSTLSQMPLMPQGYSRTAQS